MSDLIEALVRSAPRTTFSAVGIAVTGSLITVEATKPEEEHRVPHRDPSPKLSPRVHHLSKKKAAVLAEKVAKQELKNRNKVCPRVKRFCCIYEIYSNSSKNFYDHTNSRKHRTAVEIRSLLRAVNCIGKNLNRTVILFVGEKELLIRK